MRYRFCAKNLSWLIVMNTAAFVAGTPTTAGEPTVIGKLAAEMRPGDWAELKSLGYEQEALMRGDDILAYAGKAAWDGRSHQLFFIGQVHLKGPPVFISYSAEGNLWRRLPTPPWAESLKWFHAYENNAADSARGIFYHHSSASESVHKYVVEQAQWSVLPSLKAPTGHGTALEYFPEMKGLVRVLNGEVWFWSEDRNEWTVLARQLEMGPYHNFAVYSQRFQSLILGGGNGSGAVYVLAADGKVAAGKRAPVELGIGRSLNVVDPVSGELLVLALNQKFLAYHPQKDSWRDLPIDGMSFPKYAGHSVSAVPIKDDGVALFFSSAPQGMKTFLYKHAEK